VLGHADGICHIYVDTGADLAKAAALVADAKADYPAACNAVEKVGARGDGPALARLCARAPAAPPPRVPARRCRRWLVACVCRRAHAPAPATANLHPPTPPQPKPKVLVHEGLGEEGVDAVVAALQGVGAQVGARRLSQHARAGRGTDATARPPPLLRAAASSPKPAPQPPLFPPTPQT
jgi:hypothetical protein